ncbi:MAG: DNA recombination protein RmuC [Sulfuricurvum sp.]|uniref:DNA recombination protein RmuC n=1 Tax=Sulfuricurvum sp. TaxID=2025608 RepID=UPI00262CF0C7|nr:DNA recombination protein RmuC [Sulfuricurvum sp.]MDD2828487.1 DNA recombination protein RmuC [Sulfuricurvum sp.]MDD4948982.1 DNA recombination protein RmuC [Sulfuricurvum sp.]
MMYEITTLIGFIATGTLAWMWNQSRQHYALLEARALQLQELYTQEQTLKSKIQAHLDTTQSEYHALERDYAVLHTRHEESSRSFEEKIRLLDEAKVQMKVQFEQLAAQIFEQKSKTFDEAHTKGLDLLLKPFREQIAQFSTQSKEQFIHDAKERQSIKDEILRLKTLNERLSQDAINLTQALKGENKTQGNWGEIVLERILEESGLREGHEYDIQSTLSDEEGKKFRPDMIVHLPQNKDIIIDSKVSLVAYDAFIRAETDEDRTHALKQHLLSIHSHIKGLSNKRYEQLSGVRTLDFVLLFMPIEGAFLLALEQDNTFFKTAYEQNIVVVSPSTLLVTLRTIEHIWRSEYQERNAKAIAESAEALYEKLVAFVEDMEKIGEQIGRTQKSYEGAMNKLSSGKGNLIRRVESMRKLGLKPKKMLPSSLMEADEDETLL